MSLKGFCYQPVSDTWPNTKIKRDSANLKAFLKDVNLSLGIKHFYITEKGCELKYHVALVN